MKITRHWYATSFSPVIGLLCAFLFILFALALFSWLYSESYPFGHFICLICLQLLPLTVSLSTKQFYFLSFPLLGQFVSFSYPHIYHLIWFGKQEFVKMKNPDIEILCHLTLITIVVYWLGHRLWHLFGLSRGLDSIFSFGISTRTVPLLLIPFLLLFDKYLPQGIQSYYYGLNVLCLVLLYFGSVQPKNQLITWMRFFYPVLTLCYFLKSFSLSFVVLLAIIWIVHCFYFRRYTYVVPLILLVGASAVCQKVKGTLRGRIEGLLATQKQVTQPQNVTKEEKKLVVSQPQNTKKNAPRVEVPPKSQPVSVSTGVLKRIDMFARVVDSEIVSNKGKNIDPSKSRVISERFTKYKPLYFSSRLESIFFAMTRIGDNSLKLVLDATPSKVPFWEGETYNNLHYAYVPGFIYPEKPKTNLWNKFGRLYEVLDKNDTMTSVSFNYLAEGYMNYGKKALYLIAILFPLYLLIIEWASHRMPSAYRSLLLISCCVILFLPLDTTSLLVNPIKLLLMSLVIGWYLKLSSRQLVR